MQTAEHPETVPLTFENVSMVFANGTEALKNVSLAVSGSEFVSIVGPSGCGKSTLLRIAAGLIAASEGRVVTREGARPEIGFIFQEPTLMPWATVHENVALPLTINGVSAKQQTEQVMDSLSLVGLKDFAQAYPRELSGGMKMRVSFARALVSRPEILLLDEPFAALDEFTRSQLNDDLLHLCEQHQWTTLFVTHSIQEAAFLSERIVIMSSRPGRLIAEKEVPFPHLRSRDLRASHEFLDFTTEVSRILESSTISDADMTQGGSER